MFKKTVLIEVGAQEQPFTVHRELLCRASDYFAAALDETHRFHESVHGIVRLPDDRADAFEYLVQWLYTKSLEHEGVDADQPAYFRLLHLYALADKLGVRALKNDIVDRMAAIADRTNVVPAPDDTQILYNDIRESAPVRRLVLDFFTFKKTDLLIDTHEDSWDERFLRDLVVIYKRPNAQGQPSGQAPWRKDLCGTYHEHNGDERCGPGQ